MGYFTAGFAFNAAPDWTQLKGMPRRVALYGFKHKAEPLWLLACNERSDKPVSWVFGRFFDKRPYVTAPDAAMHGLIVQVVSALSSYNAEIVRNALALGSDIHARLAQPAYFFAGDDEGLDLAFEFVDGALKRLRFHGEGGVVEFKKDRVYVAPQSTIVTYEDGAEEEFGIENERALDPLRANPAIEVSETARIHEGDAEPRVMFDVATAFWPESWPDPGKTMGLGSFDPLINLYKDFEPCYRRRSLLGFF